VIISNFFLFSVLSFCTFHLHLNHFIKQQPRSQKEREGVYYRGVGGGKEGLKKVVGVWS
jgi:hypothetical protein